MEFAAALRSDPDSALPTTADFALPSHEYEKGKFSRVMVLKKIALPKRTMQKEQPGILA